MSAPRAVHLLVTLDTKAAEADYVRRRLRECGVPVVLIDTGCIGEPGMVADLSREQVFAAAGTTLAAMRAQGDRGEAVVKASEGATRLVLEAHAAGRLAGVMSLGGGGGTSIGTAAMRALPLGVPKLMVSTLASGNTRGFVGDKDIFMLNSVVDICGINRVSRRVLDQAVAAMRGLASPLAEEAGTGDRPLVAASMFGVTTPCVTRAKEVLESAGYEVLVFHATGNGGQAMESLVRDGLLAGVLDITTTELADEVAGGLLSAGPDRLRAAGAHGVPQVVSVGACDMVNFFGIDTVPEKYRPRQLHRHNANVTLMRTTAEENARIGADIGAKCAAARGPTRILLPGRGVSGLDREGQAFHDPAARAALFAAIRAQAGSVPVEELDLHINDAAFAEAAASALLDLMRKR
jgi:uncharacterized protein (UPF0261 family)